MRVAVVVEGDLTLRAAHSLATHSRIESVSVLGPTESNSFDVVDSVAGYDLVVGRDRAADLAAQHGVPAVVSGESGGSGGVEQCSIEGLALALAVGMEDLEHVAIALPGAPAGDDTFTFPSPIDQRQVVTEFTQSHAILVGRGEAAVAAAMACGADIHRVVLDDHSFMAGIALASGVGVFLDTGETDGSVPAWTEASSYLRTAIDMGLVMGERPALT